MDRTTMTRNLKLLRDRGLVQSKRIALTVKGRQRWAALLGELAVVKDSLK